MKNLELDELMEREAMPSPVFEAAPGWGGKTKKWLKENFHSRLFPALAVAVVLVGIASYFSGPKNPVAKIDTGAKAQMINLLIQPGEGIIATSRRALGEYLENNQEIALKPEQKLYIDNYFKEKLKDADWQAGASAAFSEEDIGQAVIEALALPESKLEKFRAYLKRDR